MRVKGDSGPYKQAEPLFKVPFGMVTESRPCQDEYAPGSRIYRALRHFPPCFGDKHNICITRYVAVFKNIMNRIDKMFFCLSC